MTESADGKEVYTTSARGQRQQPAERPAALPVAPPAAPKQAEEEDDLDAVVPNGTSCKRAGCKVTFVGNEENRTGDGPGTKCLYHPGVVRMPLISYMPCRTDTRPPQPIFHEGSKVAFLFIYFEKLDC